MTYVDFDICHRMASLRKLYFVTLTYLLKVNIFEMSISLKQLELAQKMLQTTFVDFYICHGWTTLRKLYSADLNILFKVKI